MTHLETVRSVPAAPHSVPPPSALQAAPTSNHHRHARPSHYHLHTVSHSSPIHPPPLLQLSSQRASFGMTPLDTIPDVVDCGADRGTGMTTAAWAGLLGAPALAGLTRVNGLSWTGRTDGLSWTGPNKMSELDLRRKQLGSKGVVEAVAGMLLKPELDAMLTKLDLRCRDLDAYAIPRIHPTTHTHGQAP